MVAGENLIIIEEIGALSEDGVFIYHLPERKLLYFNEALTKITGMTTGDVEVDATSLAKYIKDDDRDFLRLKFDELIEKQHVRNVEFRIVLPDDRTRYVMLDGYLLITDGVVAGFLKDITKDKEHENYIVNYGAKKDAALEILSHNLSGPLNLAKRVLMLTDKALRKQKYEDVSDQINFIRSSMEHCVEVIHNFLKDEHLVSERIFVKQSRYDAVEKVKIVVDDFRRSYQRENLNFVSDAKQLFVTGDDVKYFQVVNNLISNALKFTPPNCAVDVILKDTNSHFTLIVKDDGIGIPKHLQPLIFHKYTAAGRPGLQGEKSLGLGLSICKRLVELMGGEIRFESGENVGTTFFVTLPKA